MIVTLARKLLIELWRLVTTGKVPDGVGLHAGLTSPHHERPNTQFRHPPALATAVDHEVAEPA